MRLFLTGISLVVLSPVEDLQRASHVTEVEFILKGNEDLDRLEVESIRFLNDCTWRGCDGQHPLAVRCRVLKVYSLIFGN